MAQSVDSDYYTDTYSSDDDQEGHILKIPLNNSTADQIIQAAKRTTTANFQGRFNKQEDLTIVASTLSTAQDDQNCRLITRPKFEDAAGNGAKSYDRWKHLQVDFITFEEFERFVINFTLRFHDELIPVVLHLLKKVQQDHEERHGYGSVIEPGTVLRCDGTDRDHPEKPDLSAIFMSVPYFDVGKWKPPDPPKDEAIHFPRGLFQYSYPQENGLDRDGEQMFRKFKGNNNNQFLRVPQLWCLVLNSKSIITCGPTSLAETFKEKFEFVNEESLISAGPSLVKVTDFLKRVAYLSIDQCRTYLALRQSIEQECLADTDVWQDEYLLHPGESDKVLTASQWPELLHNERSVFIHVHVSRKRKEIELAKDKIKLAVEAPEDSFLIDYVGLSSSEDERDKKALTIYKKSSHHATTLDYSTYAGKLSEQLEDEGYVVNDIKSLERKSEKFAEGERPTIFKRPTEAEVLKDGDRMALVVRSTVNSGIGLPGPANLQASERSLREGTDATTSSSKSDRAPIDELSDHMSLYEDNPILGNVETRRSRSGSQASQGSKEQLSSGYPSTLSLTAPQPIPTEQEEIYSMSQKSASSGSLSSEVKRGPAHGISHTHNVGEERSGSDVNDELKSSSDDTRSNKSGGFEEVERSSLAESVRNHDRMTTERRGSMSSDVPGELLASNNVSDEEDLESGHDSDNSRQKRFRKAATMQPTIESDDEEPEPEAQVSDTQSLIEPVEDYNGDPRNMPSSQNEITPSKRDEILTDDGLKKLIREEIAAAIKRNDDQLDTEVKTRVEDEMRKRLALFGFQENQIQAMLRPEVAPMQSGMLPNNPVPLDDRPTYIKVAKEHLEEDTLKYYDLPYETYREDPNYFIILREMDLRETDILFEHTRRLRSRGKKLFIEEGGKASHDRPDYAWVRRRKRSRSRSGNRVRGSSPYTRRENVTVRERRRRSRSPRNSRPRKDHLSRTTKRRWYGSRDSSPTPEQVKPNDNIQVPPFLAWSTDTNEEEEKLLHDDGAVVQNASNTHDGALTRLTLTAIQNKIQRTNGANSAPPVSSHHPFFSAYAGGSAFVSMAERPLHVLVSELGDRPGPNSPLVSQVFEPQIDNTNTGVGTTSRSFIQWQVSKLSNEKDSLFLSAILLIDQFVYKHFPHPLLRRCWGTFHAINAVIEAISVENEKHAKREAMDPSSLIYLVKDINDRAYLAKYNLEAFVIPIESCSQCSRSRLYPDVDDAFDHLHQFHAQKKEDKLSAEGKARLGHWLVSRATSDLEQRNAAMIVLIESLHRRTKKLLAKALDIRHSVANENNQKANNYLLPTPLVQAAVKIFQFYYTSIYAIRFLRNNGNELASGNEGSFLLRENNTLAGFYGIEADNYMSKAQNELLLMAHTGSIDSSTIVSHIAIPPETVLFLAVMRIISGPCLDNKHPVELFRDHLSSLRYAAGQKPSKRILRELFLLEEEIDLVFAVIKEQAELIETLGKVLESDSYRITNRTRISAWRRIERPTWERTKDAWPRLEEESTKIHDRVAKTTQVLRYNIEIAEEGHSKAILVFTLVTIVFLPLSFVSSLFGMNTIDIRNLNQTQALFWEVAIPVTILIGGLSLLIAYKGTAIGDRFKDFRDHSVEAFKRKPKTPKPSKPIQWDEENIEEIKEIIVAPSKTLKRRKTTGDEFVGSTKLNRRATRIKAPTFRREHVRERSRSPRYQMSNMKVDRSPRYETRRDIASEHHKVSYRNPPPPAVPAAATGAGVGGKAPMPIPPPQPVPFFMQAPAQKSQ